MEPVKLVPLRLDRLYEPLLDELTEAFRAFVQSGTYILGPAVSSFEAAICQNLGAAHAVACKSGTHSLILALKAAGIRPGDEVITVGNTYYATAEAIRAIGAIPAFVDVDPRYGLLDPAALAVAIRPGITRAVIAVHLYGFVADLLALRSICEAADVEVIEDAAHAFGSTRDGVPVGAGSRAACFSLYPTKTLGAFGDAGLVTTSDAVLAERLRGLRYYADEHTRLEFNPEAEHARMDTLQAYLLQRILPYVDGWVQTRRKYANLYREILQGIPGLRVPLDPPGQSPAMYSLPCFSAQRAELLAALRAEAIHLQVHYCTNLHLLPQFAFGKTTALPNTERHNAEVFNLPTHPSLAPAEVERIAVRVREFFTH